MLQAGGTIFFLQLSFFFVRVAQKSLTFVFQNIFFTFLFLSLKGPSMLLMSATVIDSDNRFSQQIEMKPSWSHCV